MSEYQLIVKERNFFGFKWYDLQVHSDTALIEHNVFLNRGKAILRGKEAISRDREKRFGKTNDYEEHFSFEDDI